MRRRTIKYPGEHLIQIGTDTVSRVGAQFCEWICEWINIIWNPQKKFTQQRYKIFGLSNIANKN